MKARFLAHSSRAVYGTIVATAALAATDVAFDEWDSWQFLGTLVVTLVVLWFAEVYSHAIGDQDDHGLGERIREAANEHWAVLEPVVPLGIPLVLGGLGLVSAGLALTLSLFVGVVALGVWGGLATIDRGSTVPRAVGAGVVSACIGIIIIVLKTWH